MNKGLGDEPTLVLDGDVDTCPCQRSAGRNRSPANGEVHISRLGLGNSSEKLQGEEEGGIGLFLAGVPEC